MDSQVPSDGLLLATLARRLNLVTNDQLMEVLGRWLESPSRSLDQLLIDSGYLTADDQRSLKSLIAQHISRQLDAASDSFQGASEHTLPDSRHWRLPQSSLDESPENESPENESPVQRSSVDDSNDATRTLLQTFHDSQGKSAAQSSSLTLTELNPSNQRFRLLRRHASGGLGMVSVAYDAELDREVAIKEMRLDSPSDDAIMRFLMEARVTGQLDHPGIPPVYAVGYFDDGRPFYAMRLIDGATLKAALADFHNRYPPPDQSGQRSLELRKLLGAFVSVCHTLRYAHSRHVLHRDIKPSNIMLGGYGETLVLDWGLAKSKEQSFPYSELDAKAHQSLRRTDDPTQTGTGSVMGTPHYMSPEQACGDWDSVNLRSEVYSLGATLYTLLTGKLPFSGTTREEVLDQVRKGQFQRPRLVDSRIPPELDAICTKAMALERQDRFASAGELATEIEHWLADEPIHSYQETASRRWLRWLKSHQAAAVALGVFLASAAVALGVGTVLVSVEHRSAKHAQAVASEQSQRAERSEASAEAFVSKFLVVTYNNRLASVPGSEGPRLALMEEAVEQLSAWAAEKAYDRQRSFQLAAALRERALLLKATHQPDRAWSDVTRALAHIENVGPEALHSGNLPIMLATASELGDQVAELYGADAAIDFIQPYQRLAEKQFNGNVSDVRARFALSAINITMGRALAERGRYAEASELIDAAVTHCELLKDELLEPALSDMIIDGSRSALHCAGIGRSLQAWIAAQMDDREYAIRCAQRAKELSSAALLLEPDAAGPLTVWLEVVALECELECELDCVAERQRKALKEVRHGARQALEIAARFPRHHPIARLCGRIALLHAQQELDSGTLARAALAATEAIRLLQPQEGQTINALEERAGWQEERWDWLAQAERIGAEIALLEGDLSEAQVHCHAARRALVECVGAAHATGDLHQQSQRIDLVELQIGEVDYQSINGRTMHTSAVGP